jgi:hypothetical protein
MNSSDEKPVRPTPEQLHVDLRRLDWAVGLSEDTLTAITNTAEWVCIGCYRFIGSLSLAHRGH